MLRRTRVFIVELMLLCAFSGYASAEIIDDITLKTDGNGEVDAVVKFTVPIQYLRHFPQRRSADFSIYFNILGSVPRNEWQNYESHRSPPSDIVRGFTVTTRNLSTGPKIDVQFNRPAEFKVTPGPDDRTLLIHIKTGSKPPEPESKPIPSLPLPGVAPVVAPPVAVPPMPVTTKAATPPPVPPVTAKPVPEPAKLPAATPPPPVALTPEPEKPKPTPTPAQIAAAKAVISPASKPMKLGGKDGLPVFPELEQVTQGAVSAQPSESPTLAEQTKRANAQAAVMMAKGRDSLLGGEMFAAIDAFNKVLQLPPNKYSADAQLWIGIAREKGGQLAKAKLEYESYLKLYPNGAGKMWVSERLAKLQSVPTQSPYAAQPSLARAQGTEMQFTQYGNVSMYYYWGNSQTDTVATVGGVQSPTSLSVIDQKSLIGNVNVTARAYNNEFDNRLVFQGLKAMNFLPDQPDKNRTSAFYYEVKNRVDDYSARVGRQSALGGGVLGRFDGISAGYGITSNWRANVVYGRLSDDTVDSKPVFYGASLDFGVRNPLGGSVYAISQKADGLTDRKAVGGNLRYFDQGKSAIAMLDYDTQFKALNIFTVQGTLNAESDTDYNFLVDRRRSPVLSIKNAINGYTQTWAVQVVDPATGLPPIDPATGLPFPPEFNYFSAPSTIGELRQNGFTMDDILDLANKRTAVTNVAQIGVNKRIKEKWQAGGDVVVAYTSSLPESGTQNGDGTTGVEGYGPPMPATGKAVTLTGRVSGSDVIFRRDTTTYTLSFNKSSSAKGETFVFYNHAYLSELLASLSERLTLDTTLTQNWQKDSLGGKTTRYALMLKTGYQVRNNLTLEAEGGFEQSNVKPAALEPSKIKRKYVSLGFRWDF
ncbi:MAG: hypothetical protein HZB47_07255 [Nitrosomonadales bacterium]|nr:hypothetical protein [Nitrosomonadales bacterium]